MGYIEDAWQPLTLAPTAAIVEERTSRIKEFRERLNQYGAVLDPGLQRSLALAYRDLADGAAQEDGAKVLTACRGALSALDWRRSHGLA